MTESHQDELFAEPKSSVGPKLLGALGALVITALVFGGYTLLRKRHAETSGSLAALSQPAAAEPRQPPKALIVVDEATLKAGLTTIAGTVHNTSTEKLQGISVELELRRRKDGGTETHLVPLSPSELESQQEGRYSLALKAADYSSARLTALKSGSSLIAYTTAQGLKRAPERLEPKTIIVGKPPTKGGEFLNSPDNPARVP